MAESLQSAATRPAQERTECPAASSAEAAQLSLGLTVTQLIEERDQNRRQLRDLSERLRASADVISRGLMPKIEQLERQLRCEMQRKALQNHQQDKAEASARLQASRSVRPMVSCESQQARRHRFDIRYPACFVPGSTGRPARAQRGWGRSNRCPAARKSGVTKAGLGIEALDLAVPIARARCNMNGVGQPTAPTVSPAQLEMSHAGRGTLTEPLLVTDALPSRRDFASISRDIGEAGSDSTVPSPGSNTAGCATACQDSPADSPHPASSSPVLTNTLGQDFIAKSEHALEYSAVGIQDSADCVPTSAPKESTPLGTLAQLRQLAPVRFTWPEPSEFPVFPSLPSARLQALGLLPASLAELQAANAAVSIVDPNSRYRMEGPPASPAAEQLPVEDRVCELGISFANDAATLTERVKRVSLARASLETNMSEELDRLEASLTAGSTAALLDSARVLRETSARLSRTAQALGALEQECRLNFAFHLLHKFSDDVRSEKERMAGELEILRQVVEDEGFYGEGDAKPEGVRASSRFQKVGQDVVRTSSVTNLLQQLARRRKRLAHADPRSARDAGDGILLGDSNDSLTPEDQPLLAPVLPHRAAGEASDGEEQTVLVRLDALSAKFFADRRIRLFLAPLTLLVAVVFLLWALAYPLARLLFT